MKNKKRNPWKWAFFTLLGTILIAILFVMFKITTPTTQQKSDDTTPVEQLDMYKYSTVNMVMNRQDFSAAINYLLQKAQKNSGIEYRFILNKSAILMGTTKILNQKVTFSVYALPSVDKNGNIVLKIKSIGIGSLNAPPSFILNYIKKNYNLKGIVQIDSAKKLITLRLDKLTAKNDLKIKAKTLDLKDNQIKFQILIPNR